MSSTALARAAEHLGMPEDEAAERIAADYLNALTLACPSPRVSCPQCGRDLAARKDNLIRAHRTITGSACQASGTPLPAEDQ